MTPIAVSGECVMRQFLPAVDPTRGQRGEQCGSLSSSNGSSLAGAGRSARLYPSSCSSRTILSSTYSSPGRGAATRCSAGNLASSRVAGSKIRSAWRTGASGGDSVGRAGAARWLRAGAARSEVGESSLASHRSAVPGRVGVDRAGAARRFRAGAARGEVGESSLALNRSSGVSSGRGADGVGAESRLSASAEARKCRDVSFSSLFVRCMSPSQRVRACV